ncbi:hypothetical protein CABS01_03142 [Colletotrichum abscissum]|uniref:BZIP domain-containing protein n=1 Tax=Colletotrichum abscissum TaxID=1671311 RepID=A0A9P9X7X4_9PEZI|nr:uncharacterized protein CABS01_03142 [Colletotrichum abscissum]KAI3540740.1 hypothetical protein CABS02_10956 [Colletotrichum abscissum]KAK1477840.1 hypothetical protein CABS01_03142 [Colletotrichum abscissum]
MADSGTSLHSSGSERESNRVSCHSNHADADVEAKANNTQRRKLQNRNNQRAHRLRMKQQVSMSSRTLSRPFEVRRWRLDEFDNDASQNVSSASGSESKPAAECACVIQGPLSPTAANAQKPLNPPSFIFPLSTDHLLHLVQYNVFRAFVANKRTLNILLTGQTNKPSSPTTCPISGPYRDDTCVYPLNPNIPPCLIPTRLQQIRLHSLYINLFPFPRFRDNLIRHEGEFDHWELLQDLIGELMSMTPTRERQGTPVTITVSDPKPKGTSPFTAESHEDGITANRKGLIVWGEPHDIRSWEATPGFLEKWSWAVEGSDDLVEASNCWRLKRGEAPIRLSGPRR